MVVSRVETSVEKGVQNYKDTFSSEVQEIHRINERIRRQLSKNET